MLPSVSSLPFQLGLQALSDWRVEHRERGDALRPNGLLMGFVNISSQAQADELVQRLAQVVADSR
ncbi:hypothetical protein [Rahnella aquatilis]|nr:hypothetical protein [Rahnella aquatilis]